MSAPYPANSGDAWQVVIGRIVLKQTEVLVELLDLETGAAFDKQKPSGKSGATIKYQGDELASFTIRLRSWNPEGFAKLIEVCKLAKKHPSSGEGLDVAHPMLDAADVHKMVVEKIHWPGNDQNAQQEATLTCTQWAKVPVGGKSVAKKVETSASPDAYGWSKEGKKNFDLPKPPTPPWKNKPVKS